MCRFYRGYRFIKILDILESKYNIIIDKYEPLNS